MGNLVSSCGPATQPQEIAVKVNNGKKVNVQAQAPVNTTPVQAPVNTSATQAQAQANTTPVSMEEIKAQEQTQTPITEVKEKPSKGIKFRNNALENIKQIKNINAQLKQKKPVSTGTPATSILKPNTRTNAEKMQANPEDVLEQSIQRALRSKSTRNLNTLMKKQQVTNYSDLTEEQKRRLVEKAKQDEREIRQNGGKRKTRRRA